MPKKPSPEPPLPFFVYVIGLCVIAGVALVLVSHGFPWKLPFSSSPQSSFSPSPTPSTSPVAEMKIPPTSHDSQKWLLAVGGVLATQNREGFAQLASNIPKPDLRQLLANSWNITGHESAVTTLDWLKNEGHSQEFAQIRQYLLDATGDNPDSYPQVKKQLLANVSPGERSSAAFGLDFVWQHRDDLADHKLMAWDYMRLVNVSRWSYTMGFISEQEAWENIAFAGTQLRKHYHSWNEMGDEYLLGRTYWKRSTSQADAKQALNWLETNPASPWVTLPWDMKLE